MMYVVQICSFVGVTWLGIYYEWTPNPYVLAIVAFFAALLATAIIIEIKLLPARLSRLYRRIFPLENEPRREIASLPRSSWHSADTLEHRGRLRIGKDIC